MKYLTMLLAAGLLLAGCAPDQPATEPGSLPPDAPVSSPPQGDPMPVEKPDMPYSPKPGDVKLSRGGVHVNESELLIRESYPPQIALAISGDLPTPCHELRVVIEAPDSDNRINIEAYSVADPEMICIQVLHPFQENVELGTFPSGHFTVWMNGELVGEFDS